MVKSNLHGVLATSIIIIAYIAKLTNLRTVAHPPVSQRQIVIEHGEYRFISPIISTFAVYTPDIEVVPVLRLVSEALSSSSVLPVQEFVA